MQEIAGMLDVVADCVGQESPRSVGSSHRHDSLDPMLRTLGLFDSFDLMGDHSDPGVLTPPPTLTVIAERLGVLRSVWRVGYSRLVSAAG